MLLLLACTAPPVVPDPAAGAATESLEDAPAPPDPPADVPETERLCQLALTCDVLPTRDTKVPCTFRVVTEGGDVEWDGPAEAWVRGRSSASVSKPGYGVELHDDAGEPASADLLGMGGESDWVIDGLYYDRLLVRDKLGYDLFRGWGHYAAESALCELTLNGEYFGVHALVERIKRDDDRVDIPDGAETGDAFVLKQLDEDCFFLSDVTHGGWKLISPNELSPEAETAVREWLTAWEDAVEAAEAGGPTDTLWAYVDLESTVDVVLLEELFKNEDAFYTSMHLYKDVEGPARFVPWDLDMTFGQLPLYPYGDYGNHAIWIDYRPTLWDTMSADPRFRARLAERWVELRAGDLAEDALFARIDALQAILGDAIDRNFERWPIESISYQGYFYPVSTYADEEAYVREWVALRLAWMDANVAAW